MGGVVKCTKKKPQNMLGDWAGSPFKESDFPEAHGKEPKFTMPVMPGFSSWGISKHFDKVQAAQKAAIKKAAKHDTKAVELEQQEHKKKSKRRGGRLRLRNLRKHRKQMKHLMKHLKKHAKRHARKKLKKHAKRHG